MKIKKSIIFFLVFLLLTSNIELAFNVHYCGDKIASISLNSAVANELLEECCIKNQIQKENCCKDKILNFQKQSDNTIIKVFSSTSSFYFAIGENQQFICSSFENFKCLQHTSYFCDFNLPPIYKLCSQYVFYA
jgi:hypothetical protein